MLYNYVLYTISIAVFALRKAYPSTPLSGRSELHGATVSKKIE